MSKAKSMRAVEKTELMLTFYGPVAFLDSSGKIGGLFTATDLKRLAKDNGVTLLPQTLADALEEPSEADRKGATTGAKLRFCENPDSYKYLNDSLKEDGGSLPGITEMDHHFVDTRKLPWIVQGEDPKTCVSLKIVRVSPETGVVTAIVRQNGQAPPHYHLGSADFFITSGRIGYRAGPNEGYGPGVYMFEPAGARHEATQRVGDDDLVYTANIFGPIQFDSGVGTPPLAVLSWMTYLQFAKDSSTPLIRNKVDGSYLAAP
jgi:quercetin dioxygenase-like cupin family protein